MIAHGDGDDDDDQGPTVMRTGAGAIGRSYYRPSGASRIWLDEVTCTDSDLEKIEVHPLNRLLFVSDDGTDTISMMKLDGTGYKTIINSQLDKPREIVLDPKQQYVYFENENLYFTDGCTNNIEVVDLNGGNRRLVLQNDASHMYSLQVLGNYLYYTDWNTHYLMRMNKDGTGKTVVVPPGFRQLTDVRIHECGNGVSGGIGKRNKLVLANRNAITRDVTSCAKCCFVDRCNKHLCPQQALTGTALPATSQMYVRLIGGPNAYEGTVEIYHAGRWGAICDDHWTGEDAGVVCGMLGYSRTGSGAIGRSYYRPSGASRIWLDEVTCTGNEPNLSSCRHNSWGVTDCSHREDAGVLCEAVSVENDMIFLVDAGLGGVIFRMNLLTQSYVMLPMNPIYSPTSIDYDPIQGRVYFVDPKLNQILSVHFDGTDVRELKQLTADSDLEKIEVDPLNRLLFVSDDGTNTISMMKLDGTGYKTIINSQLDKPREIVLDPKQQMIYWSDWGRTPKIERSKYDGSNRQTIVSTGLKWPNGMAMDYVAHKLYFTDGGTNNIEVVDLNGGNRRLVLQNDASHMYSLQVFGKYLYYTDWNTHYLMRVNKDGTGKTVVGPPGFRQLTDVRIHEYGNGVSGMTPASPVHFDPSHVFVRMIGTATSGRVEVYANGQWGTVCNDHWDNQDAKVVCGMMGFSKTMALAQSRAPREAVPHLIALDEVNCTGTEKSIVDCGFSEKNWGQHDCTHDEDAGVACSLATASDNFLLFSDSRTGLIFRMDLNTYSFSTIPQPHSPNPVALTFNPHDQHIYYTEVVPDPGSQIRTSGLDGSDIRLVKRLPRGSVPDGIAVDGKAGILFYTDTGSDTISSMQTDGTSLQILINTNLDEPRAIVLDPDNKVMYWTDWGASPKIEKASYDGSNRKTIVSTGLKLPNGLAIDRNSGLLYFCDAGTHKIEEIDSNGGRRRTVYTDNAAHFFGLAVTDHFLYFSNWNEIGIMRVNKDGTGEAMAGPPAFTRINGLYLYQNA
ncbi:low-density lipoprotein receptor-related protein 5-like [Gigantopelta aegis]|uniref:low-density lipoprotein receptor-related protein 5-like n=1 Tax=Gigantopelta aegis TaxID=1735272 RepID=UPI001B887490|nr:low-density lipoprotein receptor-related protein 5-like [Gigantopelta aegis]